MLRIDSVHIINKENSLSLTTGTHSDYRDVLLLRALSIGQFRLMNIRKPKGCTVYRNCIAFQAPGLDMQCP